MEPAKGRRLFQFPKLAGRSGRDILDLVPAEAKTIGNQVDDAPDGDHEDESHYRPDSQAFALLPVFRTLVDEIPEHAPDEDDESDGEHQRNEGVVDEGGDAANEGIDLAELGQGNHRGKGDGYGSSFSCYIFHVCHRLWLILSTSPIISRRPPPFQGVVDRSIPE